MTLMTLTHIDETILRAYKNAQKKFKKLVHYTIRIFAGILIPAKIRQWIMKSNTTPTEILISQCILFWNAFLNSLQHSTCIAAQLNVNYTACP